MVVVLVVVDVVVVVVVVVVAGLMVVVVVVLVLVGLCLLSQTTLQVKPSILAAAFPAFLAVLKTILTVSLPENLRLAVLLPQYFLWKLTPRLPPLMILT